MIVLHADARVHPYYFNKFTEQFVEMQRAFHKTRTSREMSKRWQSLLDIARTQINLLSPLLCILFIL